MTLLSRRSFLCGTASVLSSKSVLLRGGVSAAALTIGSGGASAWIQVALAIGAIVAGMIAAHNRSDGGAMALLTANYELLRIAIAKLDQIETMVIDILAKIEQLPDEIDKRLKQENTRRLQTELSATVLGYVEKLQQKDPAQSFNSWRHDQNTRRDIATLLARLQKSRQELRTDGLVDPATALVVAPLALVEHSLLNILEYRPAEIVATLKQIYLSWLDAILDPNNQQSAADYTNSAAARISEFMKKAAQNPIGKAFGMKPGSQLLACVGVNDFTPAHQEATGYQECPDRPTSFPGGFNSNVPQRIRLLPYPPANNILSVKCYDIMKDVPSRTGPRDRLVQNVALAEKEFVTDTGQASGLLLLELTSDKELHDTSGRPGIPKDDSCTIITADIRSSGSRLTTMHASEKWLSAQNSYSEFSSLIDAINMERTRYAFGLSAMTASEAAKQTVAQLIRQYS